MAVSPNRVSVGTTATRLDVTSETDVNANVMDETYGQTVLIRNRGAGSVYLGGSAVTTATGFQLDAGEYISMDINGSAGVYAIAASGTVACHVLQSGV